MGNNEQRRAGRGKDFTGGRITGATLHRGTTGNEEFDQRVVNLVEDWGCGENNELIERMIITALSSGHDRIGTGDLKLMARALEEMRHANQIFGAYEHRRKVAAYGSARTQPGMPAYETAVAFSRKMLEHDFMTITGAGGGIMAAAQEGAGRNDSFGLNINLPFEQGANETIDGDLKLILFNYFFTRKLSFVKESDAAALFPGGFGTMDEGFESLTLMQTGKATILPTVMVDSPGETYWKTWRQFVEEHLLRRGLISPDDFHLFKVTDDVDEAVEEIVRFYRNFHSYRYVGKRLVLRVQHAPTRAAMEYLNREFADLLEEGEFELSPALREETNEPELERYPRVICNSKRRNYGRKRQLINALNEVETEAAG